MEQLQIVLGIVVTNDSNLFGCSIIKIDNPACNSSFLNLIIVPVVAIHFANVGTTGSKIDVETEAIMVGIDVKMMCYGNETVTRCFPSLSLNFGSAVNDGTMDAFGKCVK